MICDMCGSKTASFSVDIEGAEVKVCEDCTGYGKIISKIEAPRPIEEKTVKPTETRKKVITMVRKEFPSLIKHSRENKGLKQDELAKRLAEKTSTIHHLETGKMKPSIALARKLEKFLEISLITEYEEKPVEINKKDTPGMTIGDMITIK